ncbi:ATP-binding protein [Xanthobacter autotrophicus]|uniref:ATP-binding protein n=1 Tax=Xanthobacter autotrophicus TaxID=280 RepID=UPI003727EDB2
MGTIRLKTNQHRLITNLKHAFSPTSMLGELLQNARRAGATHIFIEADDHTITVTDDGSGIADLQSLIHIAESGWDEEIKRRENAFGMGVLSTLYFSERLSVHSGSHAFDASTASIIAGDAIEVRAVPPLAGTRIRLEGVTSASPSLPLPEWVAHRLRHLCEAFPVGVRLNGSDIPRPLADPMLPWRETPVGRVLIDLDAPRLAWRGFLQGLPIGTVPNSSRTHVVLLRDDMIARLPDRQYLLNADVDNPRIQAAIDLAYRQALIEAKAQLAASEFVHLHGDACLNSSNADLLNEMPFVQRSWFRDWDTEPPGYRPYWNRSRPEGLIAAEALSETGVWRIEAEDDDEPTAQAYIHARGGFLLEEGRLDAAHWLVPLTRVISPDQVVVQHGSILHESRRWLLAGGDVQLVLADSLHVSLDDDPVAYPVSAIREIDRVYLTAQARDVTRLVSDYIFDDRYDETANYDDEELIRTFIKVGRSKTPASVIEALLPDELKRHPHPKLAGATVRLVFDSEGKLQSVTD